MPSGRLRRRIANALDQDVEKEMIVVNDGSTYARAKRD
jgi:glycosyltransferase involved in cell wall biosynthesis